MNNVTRTKYVKIRKNIVLKKTDGIFIVRSLDSVTPEKYKSLK